MIELLKIANDIKKNTVEIIKEKIYSEIVFIISSLLRNYYLSKGESKNKTIHRALRNELRGLDKEDYQTDLVFIPMENKTLILTYLPIGSEKERKIMSKEVKIKDYQYWNGSESDDKVSPEEWKQRENDWGVLGHDSPLLHGFNFQIFDGERAHWVLMDKDFNSKLEKHMGPIEDMKYKIAESWVIDEIVAGLDVFKDNSTVGVVRALRDAKELVEKGEKKQEIEVKLNLMKNIQTFEDVLSLEI